MTALRALWLAPLALGFAGPAFGQAFQPPPFPALEAQKAQVEQQRLDTLEQQKVEETFRWAADPSAASASALRRLEIDREMDRVRLQGEVERDVVRRERTIAEAALPNRRIAASSVLVIRDPARHALPAAPKGQYYARLEGRFVLVDAASETVTRVLDVAPADPVRDVPLPPAPPPAPPLPEAATGPP
jgi:Ni/Co efflux regulator RcnB